MNLWSVVLRSLQYHLRSHLVVAAGVAVATAVLTGALLVGDTVRHSLTALTQERLGKIDRVLLSEYFFRDSRVERLRQAFPNAQDGVVPAVLVPQASISVSGKRRRTGRVTVIGCDAAFWRLRAEGTPAPRRLPDIDEIVLNRELADALAVSVGDRVTLRLPGTETIPSDLPFGEKEDLVTSLPELEVIEILPDRGLARFEVFPSQRPPRNAFVSAEAIREVLEQEDRWNALFLAQSVQSSADDDVSLLRVMRWELDDVGVEVRRVRLDDPAKSGPGGEAVYDYHALWSDRLFVPEEIDRAVQRVFDGQAQPVLTYLANSIEKQDASSNQGRPVPYSLVTAVEVGRAFPLRDLKEREIEPIADNEIILTSWLAEELQARKGDRIRMTYFDPESPSGKLEERDAVFVVAAVTPLAAPAQPYFPDRKLVFRDRPTLANDPFLTPPVRGFTDQDSINEWDVPFPVDYDRVTPKDEAYWKEYATTPKAFISLRRGRSLWASRLGKTTSWRIESQSATTPEAVARVLEKEIDWQAVGVVIHPLRQRQMGASKGTTPFGVLFLSLSMFVIVAALMLVALLFRLAMLQRSRQMGICMAVGFRRRRLLQWFLREELFVAIDGGVVGVLAGIAYARLMVWLLTTVWVGAITVPFLRFHASGMSLTAGLVAGVLVCGLTLLGTVRGALKLPPLELLRGRLEWAGGRPVRRWLWWSLIGGSGLGAVALAMVAAQSGGMIQAGSFVGAGFLLLTAALGSLWLWLHGRPFRVDPLLGESPLWRWAVRSLTRHPRRSMLTVGLMGASSFLIVALGAFQMQPTEQGTGGFEWIGESAVPIYADWRAEIEPLFVRRVGFPGPQVYSFRLRDGDNAACTNLYRPSQPRVIGVPRAFIEAMGKRQQDFQWGALPRDRALAQNPWRVLIGEPSEENAPIPVVLDRNTAMYSLQLYGGVGEEFELTYDGRPIRFRVAGLLADSILQGMLLIGENDFQRLFPNESGYRFFLVDVPEGVERQIKKGLEERFSDEGLEFVSTRKVLAGLLAVQNTYLQTFQALGAIGLLLGTLGLGVVQLRNVLERRRELALLQAIGFRRGRLAGMVFRENVVLLTVGLGVGTFCAGVAVLPYQWASGNTLPLGRWLILLFAIWLVGAAAGLGAMRAVMRLPLLANLRNE